MNRFLKSKRRWLVLLAVALLGAGIWYAKHREPRYQGRALSEWLADFESTNLATQANAAAAIRRIGPDALPWLVECFEPESSPMRSFRQWAYGRPSRQAAIIQPFLPPANREFQALDAFMALGPEAAPAIPDLVKRVNDQPRIIPLVLGGIGTKAIPELVKLLDSTNAVILENSIVGLDMATAGGKIPPEFEVQAVQRLVVLADYPNDAVRKSTMYCLVTLSAFVPEAVSALAKLVTDSDPDVRYEAAMALKNRPVDLHRAIPALLEEMKHPDAQVRAKAERALRNIDSTRVPRQETSKLD